MKIILTQVVSVNGILQKIKDQKMPIKTSYKFALLSKEIDSNVNFFEEKFRDIITKYGEKDDEGELIKTDDGTGIRIQSDKAVECQKEISELSEIEVELDNKFIFEINELESLELSFEDLKVLMPFIKEDKE